jgi:hypothetical protein
MSNCKLQSLLYPGSIACKKRIEIEFDVLYELFCAYRSAHGHIRIPQRFVIPDGDEAYPAQYWGFRLGAQLNSIHNVATWTKEEYRARLVAVGVLPTPDQVSRKQRLQLVVRCFCSTMIIHQELFSCIFHARDRRLLIYLQLT